MPISPLTAGVATAAPATATAGARFRPFGDDGLSFGDLLDVVNPLQHIPLVGAIYRRLTGDDLSPASRVAGGALFGGPIGALLGAVNAVIEQATGHELGEQMLASLGVPAHAPAVVAGAVAGTTAPAPGQPPRTGPAAGAQPEPRRGGWMINAAYATRDAGRPAVVTVLATTAESPAAPPAQRPGGWMVNAAYAGRDGWQREHPAVTRPGAIDTAA